MPMKIVSNQLVFICSHGNIHPLSEKDMDLLEEFFALADIDEDELEGIPVDMQEMDEIVSAMEKEGLNLLDEKWRDDA